MSINTKNHEEFLEHLTDSGVNGVKSGNRLGPYGPLSHLTSSAVCLLLQSRVFGLKQYFTWNNSQSGLGTQGSADRWRSEGLNTTFKITVAITLFTFSLSLSHIGTQSSPEATRCDIAADLLQQGSRLQLCEAKPTRKQICQMQNDGALLTRFWFCLETLVIYHEVWHYF